MQPTIQALARRHRQLSWWWGMLLAWAIGLGYWFLLMFPPSQSLAQRIEYVAYGLLLGLPGLAFFLGLPAAAGAWLRQPLMRRMLASATSLTELLARMAAVFEGFVLLSWLLWTAYRWSTFPVAYRIQPLQNLTDSLLLFAGVSLPWLVSSVAAAWWVRRGRPEPKEQADISE